MAIPWLLVLKSVPWTDVISNAPKVVEGAKKLWNSVGRKPPAQEPAVEAPDLSPAPESGSNLEDISLLKARITAMEAATADLHSQMLASTELIRTLAEQNAQLIKGIEDNRIRIKWLAGAALVFGIVAVLGLFLAAR